ncbi:TetR/AcrR family transcriptional regulator [Lactiplantibacillus paraplantarum]|uniref:TetR/AcrR family transcriptional regulator n=1 Tax=Lactiplantibacillus paraplantarum TaxID=60520 RepID=UPI002551FDC6|nr:TetR/AcrR family transcriptional regulator [Lactiplantibacillus paraplantarum]MDL2061685.1 TetR/AcrR family transcriptional regulator [Lactiplantibacillus paraplantarum]
MPATDLRVQRTLTALKAAFRTLALKYPRYRDITVKELTTVANINRKTFYLHFDSIDDLAETFIQEGADKILALIDPQDFKQTFSQSGLIFDRLVAYFRQSEDFHRVILLNDDYSFLSRKIHAVVVNGLTATIQTNYHLSPVDAKVCSSFLIHNNLTFFRLYFKGDLGLSLDELKQRVVSLDVYGIQQFFYPNRPLQ